MYTIECCWGSEYFPCYENNFPCYENNLANIVEMEIHYDVIEVNK